VLFRDLDHAVQARVVLVTARGQPEVGPEAGVRRHQIAADGRTVLFGIGDQLRELLVGPELRRDV
jgi:hypothetical protein